MTGYDTLPSGVTGNVEKFKLHISDDKISEFKQLVKLSPIGPVTYENSLKDRSFGISRDWLVNAKSTWETKFDWRAEEDFINSFPQFKTTVTDDDGSKHDIHFMALFSEKKDAIPIALFHGWPGSFLEFTGLLTTMKERYTPQTLPYHVIIPSLIGYTLSSGPPTNKDWTVVDTSRLMHKLLLSLGLKAYAVQGGDVGAGVARLMAVQYDECKAVLLNADTTGKPEGADGSEVEDVEKAGVERGERWKTRGIGYAIEHGTRPGTVGLALSSSPVALLAWIGEKYLEWSDEDPSLEEILRAVSLYWLTDTFPRSIYPYRAFVERASNPQARHKDPSWYINKPYGFSYFPKEILAVPKAWAAASGNLVWHRRHEKGGHFAAMECPEEIATDVEDFLGQVWKGQN